MKEPKQFIQGETIKWTRSFSNYPAGDWTLTYYFRGTGARFEVTAAADGTGFKITVPTATTAALAVGRYDYQGVAEKDGEKYVAASGFVTVKPGLSNVGGTFDGRSEAEIALDAIRAVIANKATHDQQEYAIGNRQLKRIPIPDLLKLEKRYILLVRRERMGEKLRNGGKFMKPVLVRMKDD